MAHNNGSGFRPLGSGVSEASAQFRGPGVTAPVAPAMSGAEMAAFVPHRPARPEKSEGGKRFKLVTEYEPAGDQPTAIADLVSGIGPSPNTGERDQVLLGVTGSGKTFTMAKVIENAAAPGADPRAQQDAGGPALQRDEELLPGKRGRVFRLAITTTTSRKPISRAPTPISRRTPPSTRRSTACAIRRRARSWNATT